jgi:alanine racemase
MGRLGVLPSALPSLLSALKHPVFQVEGIYSHFSRADDDLDYSLKQVCVDFVTPGIAVTACVSFRISFATLY